MFYKGFRKAAALALAIGCFAAAQADLSLNGQYVRLPINSNGSFISNVYGGGIYDADGSGSGSGRDFWYQGTPVYEFTIRANGAFINGSAGNSTPWSSGPTVTDTSSGSVHSATISGNPIAGLLFTRQVSFADNGKVIKVVDTLTNTSGSPINNVATLDATDLDQDIYNGTFNTEDDVLSLISSNDAAVAAGPVSHQSFLMGTQSPNKAYRFEWGMSDPFYVLSNPNDPNGASGDEYMGMALSYATLAAGQTKTSTWYMVFGDSKQAVSDAYVEAETQLTDFTLSTYQTQGGNALTGTVTLSGPAGPGGFTVSLSNTGLSSYSIPLASPPVAGPLRIYGMPSPNPSSRRVWRVRNTSSSPVTFRYKMYFGTETRTMTAPPNSDTYFASSTLTSAQNTIQLFVGTTLVQTQAQVSTVGEVPEGLWVTLAMPTSVTVPAGASSYTFNIATSPVEADVNTTLTASAGTHSFSRVLRLTYLP